ncbi:MAG: HD domain-containing protein [Cytophagales bacterium]|nr:HD domain-containing protein [Cytophagales bacterium]
MNKKKIINDPIYGFITIPNDLIFDIIEHRYFQRLRRIKQLGVSEFVYPGANHSRFHHALGAMYLMRRALQTLGSKGHEITEEQFQGAEIAILLHDLGHGPFSHSLEFNLFPGISHEQISLWLVEQLNHEFNGQLSLAIEIFKGTYKKKFLNQLVSSQLDVDRMDYLSRDSFFTGVHEGTIGAERIIKMLNLVNDELVVEEKGIYSIENFLSARRLMYWQVYLHQASVSSEVMLTQLLSRAKDLIRSGTAIEATPALLYFLKNEIGVEELKNDPLVLTNFSLLDDTDVWGSIKFWLYNEDFVLKKLSQQLIDRKLFRVGFLSGKVDSSQIEKIEGTIKKMYNISDTDSSYFVKQGVVSNSAYVSKDQTINVLTKSGKVIDVANATDLPNIKAMSKIVKKHYLCYPKELSL